MPVGRLPGTTRVCSEERMISRSILVGEACDDVDLESDARGIARRGWESGRPTRPAGRRRWWNGPAGQGHSEALLESPRAEGCRRSRRWWGRRALRPRTSSSCSSKISPTSSSSRSSSVAMPSVPPNSSSTTARWRRSRCISRSRSPQVRLAGVTDTGRTGSGSPGSQLEQIEGVEHADDLVEGPAVHRNPAVAALGEHHPDVLQRRVLVHRHDVGARGHDFAHGADAEGHYAAHHHQLVVGPESDGGALAPDGAKVGGPLRGAGRQQQAENPATRVAARASPGPRHLAPAAA